MKRTQRAQSKPLSAALFRKVGEIMIYAGCVLGLLIGCGKTVWEHPVKGTGSLQQDLTECEEQAGYAVQEGDPHTGNVSSVQEDHLNECLEARGYLKRHIGYRD